MKRPDLIILIAVWEFLSAIVSLIGIIAIAIFAFPVVTELDDIARVGGMFGLIIAIIFLSCHVCLAFTGGMGLLIRKEWGRVLSLVHAALGLLAVPIGTIIGILVIIYLGKKEIKDYFESEQK